VLKTKQTQIVGPIALGPWRLHI